MLVQLSGAGQLPVNIPVWTDGELSFIPQTGFPLLRGMFSPELIGKLSENSIGSPHLMQEFCRALCRFHKVSTTFDEGSVDLPDDGLKIIFEQTAETIGRPIFEKLARGPRQRSDRLSRKLKSGGEVDIYGLVLHALASGGMLNLVETR